MTAVSKLGFPILNALAEMPGLPGNFKTLCRYGACGSGEIFMPEYGEQSFFFQFSGNELRIDFRIASVYCRCDDIISCNCDEYIPDEFESWSEYQETVFDTVVLSESQVKNILSVDLFSIKTNVPTH